MKNPKVLFIPDRIIKFRKSLKWSQSELARQAGITSAAISQIEKGGRNPSLPIIIKLANALKIDLLELMENTKASITKKETFFIKYGDIENLSEKDQKLIQNLIKRLKK